VRRFSTRWGHWEWAVAMVAALLLAVSFWDWYGITSAVGIGPRSWTQTSGADAWHASTAWSAAVLLGVVAAVLLLAHGVGLLTGTWVRVVAVVLLLLGLGAALWQWTAIRDLGAPGSQMVLSVSVGTDGPLLEPVGKISRDDLVSLDRPGYEAGIRPGFQAGVLLLAAELGVVLAAFAARRGPGAASPAASNKEGPPPQGT
jgi:uncharacterized membrane protein YphA (DoxX/SURF4 family)